MLLDVENQNGEKVGQLKVKVGWIWYSFLNIKILNYYIAHIWTNQKNLFVFPLYESAKQAKHMKKLA